jgi:hypothetical protein
MEFLAIVGLLTAYFKHRRNKVEGTSEPKLENIAKEPSVQKPLRPDAGRLEKIAQWLGLEDD